MQRSFQVGCLQIAGYDGLRSHVEPSLVKPMSAVAVEEILQRIRQLPAEDRLLLEQRLGELAEAEWQNEAKQARQRSQRLGIDQVAIDRAISDLRRGQ